ncbi:MAG: diguanylate cyclase [Nautiliaceae bacterium]
MKYKVYFAIFFLSVFVIGLTLYYSQQEIKLITQQKAKEIYELRNKEFSLMLENKKDFLNAFAKFISSSDIVVNAFLENNRTKLINFVKPLYNSLHEKGLLEEIHFFKRPATSFVNFANLKVFNIDVSKARADILWVSTSFQPSTHFYICRLYPGLRATYPIIYKDKLLGSVSFGINIKIFKDMFEKLNAKGVSIYLNDKLLSKFLLPKKYLFFKDLPLINGYRIIGTPYLIKPTPGYEIKNNFVYTKIKIVDFFNEAIGYIVIKDDISKTINVLKNYMKNKMSIEIFSYITIIAILFLLFIWIFNKINEMKKILFLIKNQQFDKLPPKQKEKDELDSFRNSLLDVAHTIKTYISLLTQKVEDYSQKAYKDGLTNVFNKRFLKEKAHELFLKYQLSDTQVGIIMIDIDDFKKINDTYGHDVGDMVLIRLTEEIKKHIRKDDFFIRYGGEEFLLILPNSNIQTTYTIAEKIREAIQNLKIKVGDKTINFTISLGISEVRKNDKNLFEAIKRADEKLYKAKRNGKNRVEF